MSFMILFNLSNNLIMLMFFLWINFINKFEKVSMMMIFMVMIIMKIVFFCMKEKTFNFFFPMKKLLLKLLLINMIIFFSTNNLMIFYTSFEIISLNMFLLVFLSSFSFQRMKASIYMFMFMGLSTFPMLIMIFFINEKMTMILFMMSFLIKIPIMFFHLWLPKAHVEANYYDSMILASLLLKLGGYGILNINLKMNFFYFWMINSILMLSMTILFYIDIKVILAYSSIIHMNSMVVLMINNNFQTEKMFMIIMISHAFSSCLMFYLVGMIYEMSFSRNINMNKSMFLSNNNIFMSFYMILFINMALPPFMNFFSEMFVFLSMINFSEKILFICMNMIFFSCLFNMILLKNIGMSTMNKFFKLNNFKVNNMFLILEQLFMILLM